MRLYFAWGGSLDVRSSGAVWRPVTSRTTRKIVRTNNKLGHVASMPKHSHRYFCWCSCMLGFLVGGWIEDGSCSIFKISKIRTEDTLDLF